MDQPAVHNIRTFASPDNVIEVSYEGNDWMRLIRDTKVWPPGVVELLHRTSLGPAPRDLEGPYGVVGQLHNIDRTDGDVLQGQSTIG